MKKYAVIVSSCDAYQDILDAFFELLHHFWPSLDAQIILNTESLEYKNPYFSVINIHPKNKECSWTERISDVLEQIEEEYVLLFLDDFFLFDYVNTEKLNMCINYMDNNSHISTFTFYPIYGSAYESNYSGFKLRRKDTLYNIVVGILGLWRKKDLLKYTKGYKEDIWLWEINATQRCKKKYKKDEFYITKSLQDNVFSYDFSKYGLFSGQWLKPTIELFKKFNINMNFNNRGIYNEALRGKTNSIIKAFVYNPAIIPNFELNHKGSSYIPYKGIIENGNFVQKYRLSKVKSIIRWEPNYQFGFAIKNLEIMVIYNNDNKEIIKPENLFGSFIYYNDMYVFNHINPEMYIVTSKDDYIKRLIIKGVNVFPLNEDILLNTYMKETYPKDEMKILKEKINYESIVSKEKMYYMEISPKLTTINKDNIKLLYAKYNKNKFKHCFLLNEKNAKVYYSLNELSYYGIRNLTIKIKVNNKFIKIEKDKVKNLPLIVDNVYFFDKPSHIEIDVPKDTSSILIEGIFICPLESKVLKKYINKEW